MKKSTQNIGILAIGVAAFIVFVLIVRHFPRIGQLTDKRPVFAYDDVGFSSDVWKIRYRAIYDISVDITWPGTESGIDRELDNIETDLLSRIQQMTQLLDEEAIAHDQCSE